MSDNKIKMDVKWNLPATLSAALRDDGRNNEHKNYQNLSNIDVTIQGQQAVQEIVGKATELFQCLQGVNLTVDEKSKPVCNKTQKAEVQEVLKNLKEQFSKLRALYDESAKRIDIPSAKNLEVRKLTLSVSCLQTLHF